MEILFAISILQIMTDLMNTLTLISIPMKKIISLISFVGLFFIISGCINKNHTINISQSDLDLCEKDSDCILVDYNSCCATNKAINVKYKKEYNNKPEWQKSNADCSVVDCVKLFRCSFAKCQEGQDNTKRCQGME